MFNSSSHAKVTGGSFSIVHGNQHNYYMYPEQSVERGIQFQPGEEWKELLYREYERIPLGRIKLLRTLRHETPALSTRGRSIQAATSRREGDPEAERVVEISSIIDGRDESVPFLTIRYTGRGAKNLFKKDCIHFSRQRATTVPQLRAFNDSDIPIIIFHEELVSAQHFLKHNLYSVQAQCYLHLHARQGSLLRNSSEELRAWVLSASDLDDLSHLLWIRPQTGELCFGPPGPTLSNLNHRLFLSRPVVEHPLHRFNCLELPPSPLTVCNDTTFLDYMLHNVPEWLVVQNVATFGERCRIGPPHRGTRLWKEHLMTNGWTSWSSMGVCLPKRVLKIPFGCWAHAPILRYSYDSEISSSTSHELYRATGNGGMRLVFTRSLRTAGFDFSEGSYLSREEQWLTQAGRIFSCFGIPQSQWTLCSLYIITGFTLELVRSNDDESFELDGSNKDRCSPCYLFISPPPQLPGGAPDIETWLRRENLYYYSYDSEGGSAITGEERFSLRLPSFTSEVCANYAHWDTEIYDFMEQWQKAKGFNFVTTDYAESLGFPILKVIPQDRIGFEDLIGAREGEDSPEVLEDEPMDVDSKFADTSDDHDSSPDANMDMEDC
ncbi:hypothetical protein PM082_016773 [Marasmius tenuissimus]|nr:hypothetical protein PM082_016773 [Marasmius tenuissimus]